MNDFICLKKFAKMRNISLQFQKNASKIFMNIDNLVLFYIIIMCMHVCNIFVELSYLFISSIYTKNEFNC